MEKEKIDNNKKKKYNTTNDKHTNDKEKSKKWRDIRQTKEEKRENGLIIKE